MQADFVDFFWEDTWRCWESSTDFFFLSLLLFFMLPEHLRALDGHNGLIFSGMQDVVREERPESASLRLQFASKSLNGECPDKSISMGFLVPTVQQLHSRSLASTCFFFIPLEMPVSTLLGLLR